MDFVYATEAKNFGALKKVLEENALDTKSFARVGYVVKESKALGLEEGKYFVFFNTDDAELAKLLGEKLKALEEVEEVSGETKQKVVDAIKSEQDSAAEGFGAVFQ